MIYVVKNLTAPNLTRLVRAANRVQALKHVAIDVLTTKPASQDELIRLTREGVEVEDAGSDPE